MITKCKHQIILFVSTFTYRNDILIIRYFPYTNFTSDVDFDYKVLQLLQLFVDTKDESIY